MLFYFIVPTLSVNVPPSSTEKAVPTPKLIVASVLASVYSFGLSYLG